MEESWNIVAVAGILERGAKEHDNAGSGLAGPSSLTTVRAVIT